MAHPVVRLIAVTAAFPLLAVGSPASAAEPDDGPVGIATTCYGGAVRSYFETGSWGGEAGTYRTTSRCRDINVRNASAFGTEACVIFVDKTDGCNRWTYLPAKSGWIAVATDVRDGVNFRVRFDNLRYEYEPLVAYHAF
ncbi:hypothetical protein [Micromonospora mirobrigensis]|uniref:Peptidase inhibitor family I36 n=1 Tax=Micromonospora mirobrigensis TaxID=262898 RepID=A0A1C4VMH2_9ACTN|nr:hypothetical protein [Micromonospora mirobrigensis]SCE85015.1 hypothetical protein GA0070564_1011306 [Micromonospora mirobrigensis]